MPSFTYLLCSLCFILAEGELNFVRVNWPFDGEKKLILSCGCIDSLELQLKWIYGVST